jgi:hypothetical protein
MKNLVKAIVSKGTAWVGMAFLTVFFAACMDDDSTPVNPVPVGFVFIYHASPDAPSLDLVVDNRPANLGTLDYSDHSGYLNFYTGDRNLKFTPANASSALIDTTFNVADGNAYSVFVINRLSAGLETLIVADSTSAPEEGKAMVRFVNLSPDAPAFDVATTDTAAGALFENISFKGATSFQQVDAGTYTFNVQQAGTETTSVSAKDVSISPGGYYTIITRGFIAPPSGNSNVLSIEVL